MPLILTLMVVALTYYAVGRRGAPPEHELSYRAHVSVREGEAGTVAGTVGNIHGDGNENERSRGVILGGILTHQAARETLEKAISREYNGVVYGNHERPSKDEIPAMSSDKRRAIATDKVDGFVKPRKIAASQSVKLGNNDAPANAGSISNTAHKPSSSQNIPPAPPMPLELKSQAKHPGLQRYYNWQTVLASLYRVYAIPSYNKRDYHEATLPMHPSSERGKQAVEIQVINSTSHSKIDVYWIDYKGKEVHKGSIRNKGGVWNQTTYIGHPWTFRIGPGEHNVLLKYAVFRVVPVTLGADISQEGSQADAASGGESQVHRFTLKDVPRGYVARNQIRSVPVCWVDDANLPEVPLVRSDTSSEEFTSSEMNDAIRWSLQHLRREDGLHFCDGITSANILLKYLNNIVTHSDDPKYRRLRLCNRIFQDHVYETAARGVLLALGFEEWLGYMECGPGSGKMLGSDRMQQILYAIQALKNEFKIMEGGSEVQAQAH